VKVVTVIPCLNTEKTIEKIVLEAKKYSTVIVVDDGSRDKTSLVARIAGAEVIRHGRNRGYGGALSTGFSRALKLNMDIIVTLDGDGQHDPSEITSLIDPILEGKADMVIGSRFLNSNSIPTYREFGLRVISWLTNIGSSRKVLDAQSGFRAYTRDIISSLELRSERMETSAEILNQVRKKGFRIVEVPITCSYGEGSHSQNPIIHGLRLVLFIVSDRLKRWISV
jgi:glycosyltransferase involved in cell wall biosynthesis